MKNQIELDDDLLLFGNNNNDGVEQQMKKLANGAVLTRESERERERERDVTSCLISREQIDNKLEKNDDNYLAWPDFKANLLSLSSIQAHLYLDHLRHTTPFSLCHSSCGVEI